MTRMFMRWVGLFFCMFLPTMMTSFLYYRNEILQRKIGLTLRKDQRLFPKSLYSEVTTSPVWRQLLLSTPFYRKDRAIEEQQQHMSDVKLEDIMRTNMAKISAKPTKSMWEHLVENLAHISTEKVIDRESIPSTRYDIKMTTYAEKLAKPPSTEKLRTEERSKNHGDDAPFIDLFVRPTEKRKATEKRQLVPTAKSVAAAAIAGVRSSNVKESRTPFAKYILRATEEPSKIEKEAKLVTKTSSRTTMRETEEKIALQKTSVTQNVSRPVKVADQTSIIVDAAANQSKVVFYGKTVTPAKAPEQLSELKNSSQSVMSSPSKTKTRHKKRKPSKTQLVENPLEIIPETINLTDFNSQVKQVTPKLDAVVNKLTSITVQEATIHEKNVTVKASQAHDNAKSTRSNRERDRRSRTHRKSRTKEVPEVIAPVSPFRIDVKPFNTSVPVILASTNKAFLNFTDNWLESVKRSGVTSGVTLVAEDREAFDYLRKRTDMDLHVVLNDVAASPGEKLVFNSPEYKQLVNKRPSYILQLLEDGHDVLFSDVDIVWLKNPLPYFANESYDVWLQEDLHDPTVYCAGFTFYRSTLASITLVKEWVHGLALNPTHPDQRVLNTLLKKSRFQGENLRRGVMDSRLFPSGHLFFNPEWREANKDAEPVMVHNNWIVGHDLKVERFKKEGLWYLDDVRAKQD